MDTKQRWKLMPVLTNHSDRAWQYIVVNFSGRKQLSEAGGESY